MSSQETSGAISGRHFGLQKAECVPKRWGYEYIFHNQDYCLKTLVWEKRDRRSTSMHLHLEKTETILCIAGEAIITWHYEEKIHSITLTPGQAFLIVPGLAHQITGKPGTMLIEASTHDKINDSIRLY